MGVVLRTVESLWVPGITLYLAVGLAGSFLSTKPFEVFGSAARFVPTSPVGPDRQKERRGEQHREHEGVRDAVGEIPRPLLCGVVPFEAWLFCCL